MSIEHALRSKVDRLLAPSTPDAPEDLEAEFRARMEKERAQRQSDERRLAKLESRLVAAEGKLSAPAADTSPKSWTLAVTESESGLMRTVVGKAGDRTVTFNISRTPDGFPRRIEAQEK